MLRPDADKVTYRLGRLTRKRWFWLPVHQRTVCEPRTATGQRASLDEHNRFWFVIADPAYPFDVLDDAYRAPKLGALVVSSLNALHGINTM